MTLATAIEADESRSLYRARQERHNRKRRAQRHAEQIFVCKPAVPEAKQENRSADVVPRHVSFAELASNECRYPYGDGPFTFCGCEALPGKSYCEPHQTLSYGYETMTAEELVKHRRDYRRKGHGR